MKKLCFRGLAALLALLLLAACAGTGEGPSQPESLSQAESLPQPDASQGESPAQEPDGGSAGDESYIYSVYMNMEEHYFDGEGNRLSQEEVYTLLYDLDTNEPRYRLYTRTEDTGEDDEWGYPVTVEYSRLCGLDGSVIVDWEAMAYGEGVGGYVIRREPRGIYEIIMPGTEYETALWDPAAGTAVVEGVDSLQKLGNGHFLALDPSGLALGVLDGEGNILSGFPAPANYYYPTTQDGWILGNQRDPYGGDYKTDYPDQLMDENFDVLLEGEAINIGFIGLRGPFLLMDGEDGATREVRSLEDYSLLFAADEETEDLRYFDGELVILRTGDRENWKFALMTPEREVVADGFDQLSPEDEMTDDYEGPAPGFLGRKGETVYRLDREGNILAQAEIPGLDSVQPLGDGYTSYTLADPDPDSNSYGYLPTGFLDPELSVVVEADRYTDIYRLSQWDGRTSTDLDLLRCSRQVNGTSRRDILDLTGRVVADGLSSEGTVYDGRFAVVRGFSVGLMDLSGNWISRYSIYDGLNDK